MARILIVDDDKDMRNIIKIIIESKTDLQIIEADSGAEAIQTALTFLPDIIIMDVLMPDIDGWEVLRRIRDNVAIKKIPVILCSGSHLEYSNFISISPSLSSFLVKPFDIKDLLSHINMHLASNQSTRGDA